MTKTIKKHCSILNYLRHNDKDLYELMQDLCIGRMLIPRRNTPGITFLRPDANLLKKIFKMAVGDDPEEAVAAMQSLVLLDHLPTPEDFEDKKDSIPTYLRKKLPVATVSSKKIHLKNGAEIVLDHKFEPRKDRNNMSVYIISKELVPTDTETIDLADVKKKNHSKRIRGGAEFKDGKKALFEHVLNKHSNEEVMKNGNPAMEVLTSLCDYLKKNNHDEEYDIVCSQLSWDTLASLAIVLQPYRTRNDLTYVPQGILSKWAGVSTKKHASLEHIFYYQKNVLDKYQQHMNHGAELFREVRDKVKKIRDHVMSTVAKINVIGKISSAYLKIKELVTVPKRADVLSKRRLALAESELRVFSAILHDISRECPNIHELKSLYITKCNLNEAHILSNKDQINMSNIGFYFSSAYLIARSDALVYFPGYDDEADLDEITNETVPISLDKKLKGEMEYLQSAYEERDSELDKLLENLD